ncbi:MAG: hypothetical protein QME46_04990 [Thermoanaerobacteraceae bacterium]|nr:hypothetical protein [Thermoanaerobacteraceae bacterium]
MNNADYSWVTEETIINYFQKSKEILLTGEPEKKRDVIKNFVDRIIIYPDKINIVFKINLMDSDKVGGGEGN